MCFLVGKPKIFSWGGLRPSDADGGLMRNVREGGIYVYISLFLETSLYVFSYIHIETYADTDTQT